MINFNEEAEKLCRQLDVPNKVYKQYLANKLEMMYTQGQLNIVKEFKTKMRENNEENKHFNNQ